MKKICRYLVTFLVTVCLLANLSLVVLAVEAASYKLKLNDTEVAQISVSGTANSIESTNGTYKISSKGGWFSSTTSTLTFTNKHGGEVKIEGATISAEGTPTWNNCTYANNVITMPSGGSFKIAVKAGSNKTVTATFTFTGIYLEPVTPAVTFAAPSANGTFTVSGSKTVDGSTITGTVDVPGTGEYSTYTLTATPATDYKVYRWKFTNSSGAVTYVGEKANPYTYTASEAGTITCEFIPTDTAMYTVGGVKYVYFDEALTAAGTSKQIVVTETGTMYGSTGQTSFTIPNGVTLVLPYAAGQTLVQSGDQGGTGSSLGGLIGGAIGADIGVQYAHGNYGTVSTYFGQPGSLAATNVELTIPGDTTVNNNGIIAVGGTMGGNAAMSGAHSNLRVDGTLNLNSSTSVLSAIGYVHGDGKIFATGSGAKILQPLSLLREGNKWCWTIGNVGKTMSSDVGMTTYPEEGADRGNPSPRYTTQAIQCELEMKYGNTMYGYVDMAEGDSHYRGNLVLVGSDSSKSLIALKSGATLTSTYDSTKKSSLYSNIGKLKLKINGGATQGKITLSQSIYTLDLSGMPFPVPYNFDIVLEYGTYDLKFDLNLLTGAGLKVGEGATLNIPSGVKLAAFTGVNDHSHFGQYSTQNTTSYNNGTAKNLRYPAIGQLGNTSGGSNMANLVVNGGTLNVESGAYLGGIVQTTGSGTVIMNGVTENAADKDYVFTRQLGLTGAAVDHDGDKCYFSGATIYKFYPQLFDAKGTLQTMESGKTYKAVNGTTNAVETFTFDLYTSSSDVTAKVTKTETINAKPVGQWSTPVVITLNANDGTETVATVDGLANVAVTLPENTFVRDNYTFTGWNTQADGKGTAYEPDENGFIKITVTADTTLYAQWKSDECIHEGEKTSEAIKAPTCTIPGLNKITCSECDEVVAEMAYVSATGHKYVEGVCSVCNHEEAYTWTGKSAVFVGDSITYGAGTDKIYHAYLKETLGFGSVTNMGISSSCISTKSDYGTNNSPLINRYLNIPSANLIVVFMGTNDYGHETPLGTINDEGDVSFYGALNTIVPALVENHPNSKIVFATPLHRYGFGTSKILGTAFTDDNIPNGVGATLGDYVEAVKLVCAKNGVSVIDLHTLSESVPELDPKDANYFPDGLHPNAAGHEIVADIMDDYLLEYAPETLSDLVYGNKFINDTTSQNRLSTRVNMYLRAGTVITLKDSSLEWACAMSTGENTSDRIDNCYFPVDGWAGSQVTATVQKDGWVGITFRKTGDGAFTSDEVKKPLSDYVTIKEPDWVYGNRFAGGEFATQTNRMSTRVNLYLEAGTTLTLNDADNYKWCCYANSGENTNNNSATIGAGQWNAPKSVKVPSDGWVGIAIAPKNNAEFSVDDLKKPLSDYVTITESELIHGNKFQPDDPQYQTPDRASTRYNLYLEAGTSIKLKDTATFEWACAMTDSEDSKQMIGDYFPGNGWSTKANATVPNDGWVGIVLKYKDSSKTVDLCTSLSDYVIICKHNYDAEETTAATCLKDGVKTYTCSECGDSYTEAISATGHKLTQVDAKAASCEAIGWNAYEECSVCDYTTYVEIPATGHAYEGKETSAPTCTDKGVMTYTCKNDASHTYTEEIAAKGHTLTQVDAKAPTCTEAGYEAYEYCSVCDYTTYKEVAATGHNYESVVTPPEFGKQGYTTHTCSCGDSYVDTYVDALIAVAQINGQKYVSLGEAVAAALDGQTIELLGDFTGAGVVIDKSITIDFDNHTYTFNKAVGSSGTATLGFQILKGHNVVLKSGKLTSTKVTEGKEVKILIQNYSNLTLTDMVLDGTNENILYGLSNNSGAIALNGATSITVHDSAVAFDVYDYSSAGYAVPEMTVNTTGTITGKIKVSETATLAISDGNFSVKPESDWCAEGYGPNIEDVNGYYGVHKHVEVIDAAKEATCTATGLTEGKHCSVCNGVLVAQTVIDALGHEMAHNDAVAPDCTNDGTVEYWYCSVCNKNFSDEEGSTELTSIVDGKLGHKFAEELSYDENGHWYACTRTGCTEKKDAENHAWDHACDTDCNDGCGYTRTITHSYTEASEEVVIEANCVTNAVYKAKCAVCGDVSDTERITGTTDATKHTGKTDVRGAKDATCVAMGYTGDTHCSDCNELLTKGTAIEMLTTHTYPDSWTQTKAPTCTEEGSEYRKCTVEGCESTETRDIAMVAHSMSHTAAKDATCAETGNYEYWYCSVCKGYFKDEQGTEAYAENAWVIEKTDHIFETTYTTDGEYHWYKCTNPECDAVDGKAVHSFGDQWKHDDDDHWHECSCGYKVDVAEHGWDDGVVTTQPTTSATGVMTYTCDTCETTRTEAIAQLTGYVVTLDDRTISGVNQAYISLVDQQRYEPGATFTVKCAMACVVAIYDSANGEYIELCCTAEGDNTYKFTIPDSVNSDFKIGVVLRGDANSDGKVNAQDRVRISKYRNHTADLDALEYWAADANADGRVNAQDRVRISKYRNHTAVIEWKLN